MRYKDSCKTYVILLQDSGFLPKPEPDWNVFIPQEGDLVHVDEDDMDYVFNGEEWEVIINGDESN